MKELGTKLRSLRKERGLSLVQLCGQVKCSPSYLSMVENGKVDPSISRLKKITDALDVTIVDLFQNSNDRKIVIRRNERPRGEITRSKTEIEMLIQSNPDNQLDARVATIHPDGCSNGYYRHPGEEFGLVLSGTFELTIDGVIYTLEKGDSFYFESPRNHSFRNPGTEDAVIVWVNHPPSW